MRVGLGVESFARRRIAASPTPRISETNDVLVGQRVLRTKRNPRARYGEQQRHDQPFCTHGAIIVAGQPARLDVKTLRSQSEIGSEDRRPASHGPRHIQQWFSFALPQSPSHSHAPSR